MLCRQPFPGSIGVLPALRASAAHFGAPPMPIPLAQQPLPIAGELLLSKTHPSTLTTILHSLVTWIVRSGQRRALRELAEEGRLLSDIGLTRERALREATKPFWMQ